MTIAREELLVRVAYPALSSKGVTQKKGRKQALESSFIAEGKVLCDLGHLADLP